MWLSVGVLLFIALKSLGIVKAYDKWYDKYYEKWFGGENESEKDSKENEDHDNEEQTPREGGESMPNNTNYEIEDEEDKDQFIN